MGKIKITNEQKEEIRSLYDLGNCTKTELAKMYNCSRYYIAMIINDELYQKHKHKNNQYIKDNRDRIFKTCPKCGKRYCVYNTSYCSRCGAKLNA